MRPSQLKIPEGMDFVLVLRGGQDFVEMHLQVVTGSDISLHAQTQVSVAKFEGPAQDAGLQSVINQLWDKIQEDIRLKRYNPEVRG